jgi:thiosulfate/3-mercaptopyruvate sulfurtransferase
MNAISPVVTANWLYANLNHPSLIILDASLKKPIKAEAEKEKKVISNALYFDLDEFSDVNSHLPHMMPTDNQFTESAQNLGINTESILVIYDNAGIYSSARVWWIFLAMGFQNVYVLDGGLPEWLNRGYHCLNSYAHPMGKGNFIAQYNHKLFSSQEQVFEATNDKNKLIIDARSADRFFGRVDEPRKGLRKGHIPNSINIPFESILHNNKLLDRIALEEIFEQVDKKNKPLIFSCGSGVTACIDALGATIAGYTNLSVYDGSWSEWGLDSDYPIE